MSLRNATVATRLPVQDLDRARSWYRDKLGLEALEEREGGLRYVFSNGELSLFVSAGEPDGTFTQIAFTVEDIDLTVTKLQRAGVEFLEYDTPGIKTVRGIADLEGQYPSKGRAERGAWFHDSEGNLLGVSQILP
jgi:catechol 2,3-dioxygenase-like lactoylglutathione lyase family enzyme